ncbi:MAG: ATP-binding cassette domain-containing protein [Ruminococcus flavefaciens]|nr:ATP-binding cassette domain-containing protein [Ruminococcus flavefaciens]
MVVIENMSKKFKEEVVLKDVNMQLEPGKIYGLVGHNGSGKTVLMKCLCGLLHPTTGSVTVNDKVIGVDIDFPESLGLMIETPGFIPYMSGKSNLKNLAMIQNKIGEKEICDVMRLVGLDPDNKKRVSKYSLGMRQRLGIAQAIMEKPQLLILDEPFNGLDEDGVKEMRNVFFKLKEEGATILLASHMKEDVRVLCDTVYQIKDHQLVLQDADNAGEEDSHAQ